MKPIHLIICGFGPYAGKADIHMDEVEKDGMFLITGDTGAGKTSIFDAITYALFGEASGDVRDVSMFRSKYAGPETPTSVELEFSHNGETYTVQRNPEYMRFARRGNGMAKQSAEACLSLPDGRVVTKVKEVDAKIREILGIDKEQFCRISMLAQGNFQKLLFADTAVRQSVFRTLFNTGQCQKIQEKLKEDASEISREYAKCQQGIIQALDYVTCPPGMEFQPGDDIPLEKKVMMVSGFVEQDTMAENNALKQKAEVEAMLRDTNTALENIRKNDELQAETRKTKDALEEARTSFQEARKQDGQAREKLEKAKRLKDEAGHIRETLPDYRQYKSLGETVASLRDWLEKKRQLSMETAAEEQADRESMDHAEAELRSLKSKKADKASFVTQRTASESMLGRIGDLEMEIAAEQKAEARLVSAKEEYLLCQKEADQAASDYNSLFRKFLSMQAGILASGLEEGRPCPVCGSVHHPAPATPETSSVSEDDVEAAKQTVSKAQGKAREASNQSASAHAEVLAVKERVRKLYVQLFHRTDTVDAAFVRRESEKYVSAIEEMDARIAEEEKREKTQEKLEAALTETRSRYGSLAEKRSSLMTEIQVSEATLKEKTAALESLGAQLEYPAESQAVHAMEKALEEAAALEQGAVMAGQKLKEAEASVLGLEGKLEALEKQLRDFPDCDRAALAAKAESLELGKAALERTAMETHSRANANKKALGLLETLSQKVGSLDARYRMVKKLADTACGMLAGKDKVTFETYVQSHYFDRVLAHANSRLLLMTDGQYELVRAKNAADARSKSGLDINVIDHCNGSERSAKSLSGGESFLASLALALGLSDVVQADAGGIQVDSVFIDEGFGSLDPDTLDLAFRALASLTQGSRVVGVISHVEELRDRITNQIVVKKTGSDGSFVKVITG